MMHEAPTPTPQIAAAWKELEVAMSDEQANQELEALRLMHAELARNAVAVRRLSTERHRAICAAITTALSDLDALASLLDNPMALELLRATQARLRQAMEGSTSDE